jgi:hypothetical protein
VHLVYLDDSATESGIQLMGSVIVPEAEFMQIENYLAYLIDELVPEELRDQFEFHASAMVSGKSPFDKLPHDDALKIIENCLTIVENSSIAFVYAGVDMNALRSGIYATAQPVDITFRRCISGIAGWFHENPTSEIGMFICDKPSNDGVRQNLQKAFHAYRRRLRSATHERGLLQFVHDDMYFGDSAYSVGLQLADICTYVIQRHAQGKEDTEYLYAKLEPKIFYGIIEPDGAAHGNAAALSLGRYNTASWIAAIRS